jgi:hypothetical protein
MAIVYPLAWLLYSTDDVYTDQIVDRDEKEYPQKERATRSK